MSNREIALSYLEKGLSVIPLYSPEMLKVNPPKRFREELGKEIEKNKQSENPLPENDVIRKVLTNWCKTPCIPEWTEYQKKLPSKEKVTHWFTMNPSANIAIITGAVSNLVVLDLDSEQAGEYVQEIGGLPKSTVMANTGRGRHIYLSHPGFHVSNQTNRNIHIDVRGDGGYVVAPPSLHGSGRQYEWVEGSS
ncbi:MAG: bifunctional DNA primase/polymerase, partial [Deltaproteobacteria bacterium]|nr:bifunctional DNA primase/polymerase [Deltaproteobacteria bacterium]